VGRRLLEVNCGLGGAWERLNWLPGPSASLFFTKLTVPQEWALAVMNHRAELDGIQYQSRFTSRKCLALFDRRDIGPQIRANLLGGLSGQPEANKFLHEYKVVIV
jgi:hypothetical protein